MTNTNTTSNIVTTNVDEVSLYRFTYAEKTFIELNLVKDDFDMILNAMAKGTKFLCLSDDIVLNLDRLICIRKLPKGENNDK